MVRRPASMLLIIVLAIANGVIFYTLYRVRDTDRSSRSPVSNPEPAAQNHRGRTDTIIKTIGKESTDDSINKLTELDLYKYPGYYPAKKFAQVNLEVILSNRRFIKVLEAVNRMSRQERVSKCRETFERMLALHSEAIEKTMSHMEDPAAAANSQSLEASQLALGTALFLSAEYVGADAFIKLYEEVEAFRDKIEERFHRKREIYSSGFDSFIRGYCVPDNRFLLNVLRLSVMNSADLQGRDHVVAKITEACKNLLQSEIPVVAWKSAKSFFDLPLQGVDGPADDRPVSGADPVSKSKRGDKPIRVYGLSFVPHISH